jgi:hypothetical protein
MQSSFAGASETMPGLDADGSVPQVSGAQLDHTPTTADNGVESHLKGPNSNKRPHAYTVLGDGPNQALPPDLRPPKRQKLAQPGGAVVIGESPIGTSRIESTSIFIQNDTSRIRTQPTHITPSRSTTKGDSALGSSIGSHANTSSKSQRRKERRRNQHLLKQQHTGNPNPSSPAAAQNSPTEEQDVSSNNFKHMFVHPPSDYYPGLLLWMNLPEEARSHKPGKFYASFDIFGHKVGVYAKPRPYVVVQIKQDSCKVLPVYTHGGKGLEGSRFDTTRNEYVPLKSLGSHGNATTSSTLVSSPHMALECTIFPNHAIPDVSEHSYVNLDHLMHFTFDMATEFWGEMKQRSLDYLIDLHKAFTPPRGEAVRTNFVKSKQELNARRCTDDASEAAKADHATMDGTTEQESEEDEDGWFTAAEGFHEACVRVEAVTHEIPAPGPMAKA